MSFFLKEKNKASLVMDSPSDLKLNSKLNLIIILMIAFVDYLGIG